MHSICFVFYHCLGINGKSYFYGLVIESSILTSFSTFAYVCAYICFEGLSVRCKIYVQLQDKLEHWKPCSVRWFQNLTTSLTKYTHESCTDLSIGPAEFENVPQHSHCTIHKTPVHCWGKNGRPWQSGPKMWQFFPFWFCPWQHIPCVLNVGVQFCKGHIGQIFCFWTWVCFCLHGPWLVWLN